MTTEDQTLIKNGDATSVCSVGMEKVGGQLTSKCHQEKVSAGLGEDWSGGDHDGETQEM